MCSFQTRQCWVSLELRCQPGPMSTWKVHQRSSFMERVTGSKTATTTAVSSSISVPGAGAGAQGHNHSNRGDVNVLSSAFDLHLVSPSTHPCTSRKMLSFFPNCPGGKHPVAGVGPPCPSDDGNSTTSSRQGFMHIGESSSWRCS